MLIETSSRRLALLARLCRWFPPGFSGVFLRLYPHKTPEGQAVSFTARSSIADVTLSAPRIDWVSLCFAVRGFWEWQNVVIANLACRPGDSIVEVGANIGTESVLYARIVGSRGRLTCFEPLPANAELLESNLRRNRLSQAVVLRNAVSDRAGTLRFAPPAGDDNSGMGRLVDGVQADTASIEVQCVTLDALRAVGDLAAPRLLVIDVQGAELAVLRGAERMLREDRPIVVVEAEAGLLAEHGDAPSDVFSHMKRLDYQTWQITKWGLTRDVPTSGKSINCVCFPGRGNEGGATLARRIHGAIRRAALLPLISGLNPLMIAKCD
ncbi:MAG: FkbM family methyltransferase [Phycisphaerae bacterium]